MSKAVAKPKKIKEVPYEKALKTGMIGPQVAYACAMLQKHGSTLKPTDKFHVGMRSAVICFQKKNGLKPTGAIDKKTWDKLVK